ncbi:disease resistance protein RUN1-like isoform X2 [Prosopis cineraria]|uniref:disease resistance protein RUN1-like isoform X2 n=1 Tax=Prosopis cineraria TaxID=364024 RepID=UPI00240FBFD8|nr:disease resistance protein RUN1-like isoform X2 [Prosopis cineraria]XP_054777001.1 disease resistance protein RUN1-like isoform X2 [Prosopis cineraria]
MTKDRERGSYITSTLSDIKRQVMVKLQPNMKRDSKKAKTTFRDGEMLCCKLATCQGGIPGAGGLPLALHVLGTFLRGRSMPEWKDALDKLKKIPDDNILQILKISYDGLNDEEKTIFLDIACFFREQRKEEVIQILKNCDLFPTIEINILMEKALLVEKKDSCGECILEMHDLLQELGRNIVFQESPSNVGRRSRLWKLEDIHEILKNNTGSEAMQAIVMRPNLHELEVNPKSFSKMTNLKLLILPWEVKLSYDLKCFPRAIKVVQWYSFPLEALPLQIPLDKLVDINMHRSKIKQLRNGLLFMQNLKFIDMRGSEDLVETPDFSGVPNLEKLILDGCSSLVAVHPSLGELKKVVEVSLRWCTSLEILPRKLEMNSLMKLSLFFCCRVFMLPEFVENMKKLSSLNLSHTAITNLPESLGFLIGLRDLNLSGCNIAGCSKGFKLPKNLNDHEALREHDICEAWSNKRELNVSTWSNLHHIFEVNLTSLSELDLSYCCISDDSLPDDFGGLPSLIALDLGYNDFVNMPSGCFSKLFHLHYLFFLIAKGSSHCQIFHHG